ncbi:hypothetical protein BDZ45DRAFT_809232 [Acephala macrosclerotiorum]|nr:hypothetical protein BDZ45DRAFT_809232 [Acephala macrosclerotiorum]
MAQHGTIQRGQQSDLEAAIHLPNNPIANDSVSSARERDQLDNQPRSRLKGKQKDPPKPRAPQDPVFFDTLRGELEDSQRHHCLFLCWEDGAYDQRAVPLLIEDIEDEMRIYQDLVRTWYKMRGWWWRYIPFYGILGLEEVKFRFLRKHNNDFSVRIEKLNIPRIEEQLINELEQAEAWIARITSPVDFNITCYEDTFNGLWEHECLECLAATEPDALCPFQWRRERERKLDRLRLLSLPLLCFQDPKKAVDQWTLKGMAQESCIYRTSDIKCNRYFMTRVAETKFRGLMIHWGCKWRPLDVPAVALIIVTLWKASGGNWEAAFAAGGFYIMLVSLSPRLHK